MLFTLSFQDGDHMGVFYIDLDRAGEREREFEFFKHSDPGKRGKFSKEWKWYCNTTKERGI